MDVAIYGRNFRVNDSLDDYARRKLHKLDRYLPNIRDVRVDLAREHTRQGEDFVTAQITIRHQRGAILRAEERDETDMEKAISRAIDKMYRQIQRFKGKRRIKGRERFVATMEELETAETIPDVEVFEEPEVAPPVDGAAHADITRRKDVVVTAMNESEAIEQMELLGHSFFVFYNAGTGSINVLYRRDTGGYGVLVPRVE